MCSLEVHCRNQNREGTEYYKELASQVDKNNELHQKKKKKIDD